MKIGLVDVDSHNIALDVCAALVYAYFGEWPRVGHWLSAASISVFATIM